MADTKTIKEQDATAGYWEWDVGKENVIVDDSLQNLLGYTDEIGSDTHLWRQLVKPASIDKLCEKYTAHIESKGKVPFVVGIDLLNKAGSTVNILITGRVITWSQNEPIKMMGSYLDITAHKETKKQLLQVKDLLTKTNQAASIGGWELDLETGVILWTEITKRIFGVPDDFIPQPGASWRFFKSGKDRATIKRVYKRAIDKGIPYDVELKIITANGKELWTRTVGQPEFVNGKCIRLFGVFQDINERKLNEEALKRKNEQLKKAIIEKQDFLSIMSHEIRTPMNAVIGFTNLLLQNPRPDQTEYLNVL